MDTKVQSLIAEIEALSEAERQALAGEVLPLLLTTRAGLEDHFMGKLTGISIRVRRYRSRTSLAPSRSAVRAQSIAVLPPPTTMTSNSSGYNMVQEMTAWQSALEEEVRKLVSGDKLAAVTERR